MGFRNAFNGIPPSSITSDLLADGSVTGTKLSADAIDGKVITGATLRTAAAGQRVQIDHVPDGHVLLYTEAETQAPVGTWSPGLVETDYARNPGAGYYEHVQSMVLKSPTAGPGSRTAQFELFTGTNTTNANGSGYFGLSTEASLNADDVSFEGNTSLRILAPNFTLSSDINADPNIGTDITQTFMRDPSNPTTFLRTINAQCQQWGGQNSFTSQGIVSTVSTGPAVQVNTSNWILFRASSGLRYKVDVEPLADFLAAERAAVESGEPDGALAAPQVARFAADSGILSDADTAPPPRARGRVIDIVPIRYRDRHQVEMHEAGDPAWSAEPEWFIGWTADDFHAAGYPELVNYDEQGRPDYLYYERVLAVAVLEFKDEIAELRARLDALSG